MANVKKQECWYPTKIQEKFLLCPATEVLLGGSRGGGKSEGLLVSALGTAECGFFSNKNWRALIVRRTYPELEKTMIQRSLKLLTGKAKYDQVRHKWTSECGGVIQFGVIENDADVWKHLGDEYNFLGFEELTTFTLKMYQFLQSGLRTTDPTITCMVRSTTNPSGIGHAWVKERFIDSMPPNTIKEEEFKLPDGQVVKKSRCFIPATVYDNPHIMKNNPQYVAELMSLPDIEKRAFLYGDWNIFSGQFFNDFTEDHITEPFNIPVGWPMWISMDYGFSTKCAILFFTKDLQTEVNYLWHEIYVTRTHPDVLSSMIKEKLGRHFPNLLGRYADRRISVTDEETQLTTKEKFSHNGLYFQLSKDDRVEGWRRVRELLLKDNDGQPKFKVFKTCKEFLRVVPEMIFDMNKPEDLVRKAETHLCDAWRYWAMMRKTSGVKEYEHETRVSFDRRTGYPCRVEENDFNVRGMFPELLLKMDSGKNYYIDKAANV